MRLSDTFKLYAFMVSIDIVSLLLGLALLLPPPWLVPWVNVVDGRYVWAVLCLFGGICMSIATVHVGWNDFSSRRKTREGQPMVGGRIEDK